MKTYLKCLAAYLTGWIIAQGLFLRAFNYFVRSTKEEGWRKVATGIADELQARNVSMNVKYPYNDGDVTVIGPECIASSDGNVIAWKGETYSRVLMT